VQCSAVQCSEVQCSTLTPAQDHREEFVRGYTSNPFNEDDVIDLVLVDMEVQCSV
jgi:hypothetical protein